jgi:DNA-directed RNA polymerase specialized sigma24 family protein
MSGRIVQSNPATESEAFSVARCPENVSYCAQQTCGRDPSTQPAARRPYPRMELTPENFDLLLSWLHPDPDEAGRIYVKIRAGLVRNFARQGVADPEELADKTVDRVVQKLPEIIDNWEGAPERYFYRVAFWVLREYWARTVITEELNPDAPIPLEKEDNSKEIRSFCLDECMARLNASQRDLIVEYYGGDKGTRIRRRKELAARLNIEMSALRVKALRIRKCLKKCTKDCIAKLDQSN